MLQGVSLQAVGLELKSTTSLLYDLATSRGVAKGGKGGRSPPQSSEKPFFQNIEIRVENCWGDYLIVKEDQFTKKRGKNI